MPDVTSSPHERASVAPGQVERTYQALAKVYDEFTAADDYPLWTSMLNTVLEELMGTTARGQSLLDMACGTGNSTFALADLGYHVGGFDLSAAMVEQAKVKRADQYHSMDLWVADMTTHQPTGTYDVVTCLDDAVNHVLDPTAVRALFRNVASCLAPDGVFTFDTNTRQTYRAYWSHDGVDDSNMNTIFARRSLTPGPFADGQVSSFTLNSFVRHRDQGSYERIVSTHSERHYSPAWIDDALDASGLSLRRTMGLHDSGQFDIGLDENYHTKAIYFASQAG